MAGIESIKIEDAIISNGDFLPLESVCRVGRVQNAIFFNGNRVSCENTLASVFNLTALNRKGGCRESTGICNLTACHSGIDNRQLRTLSVADTAALDGQITCCRTGKRTKGKFALIVEGCTVNRCLKRLDIQGALIHDGAAGKVHLAAEGRVGTVPVVAVTRVCRDLQRCILCNVDGASRHLNIQGIDDVLIPLNSIEFNAAQSDCVARNRIIGIVRKACDAAIVEGKRTPGEGHRVIDLFIDTANPKTSIFKRNIAACHFEGIVSAEIGLSLRNMIAIR